jgi:peptidoglycan/LPS O-acetylase OafA/YrhL
MISSIQASLCPQFMPQPPQACKEQSSSRIAGVDILRGVAIFLVLMNHVNMRLLAAKVPYTRGLPKQLVSTLVWNGQYGVQIFFVVSGFLITSTALRRWGFPGGVKMRAFYQLRFARIAPLLFALLTVLSVLHFARIAAFVVPPKIGGLQTAIIAALTFQVNLLEARHGYLPASWDILWSLSVEESFYLFFPLACRIFRRARFFIIPLCAFMVLGPFARSHMFNHNPVWREYSYLGGMDAIAMGCITALISIQWRFSKKGLRASGLCGAILVIFCLCFSELSGKLALPRNGLDMSILAIGTSMIVIAAAQSGWQAPRFFSPLLKLGERSYEIYLTHLFVVLGLFGLFVEGGKPLAWVPGLFIATILISGMVGDIVARCYSEALNRWLRERWMVDPEEIGTVLANG